MAKGRQLIFPLDHNRLNFLNLTDWAVVDPRKDVSCLQGHHEGSSLEGTSELVLHLMCSLRQRPVLSLGDSPLDQLPGGNYKMSPRSRQAVITKENPREGTVVSGTHAWRKFLSPTSLLPIVFSCGRLAKKEIFVKAMHGGHLFFLLLAI